MRFYLDSDIVAGGINEDGERTHYHVYYIVAEDGEGFRWQYGESGTDRCAMQALLDHFEQKAKNSEALDIDEWSVIQPAYGSEAYAKDWNRWEFESMDDNERSEYLRRTGRYPY